MGPLCNPTKVRGEAGGFQLPIEATELDNFGSNENKAQGKCLTSVMLQRCEAQGLTRLKASICWWKGHVRACIKLKVLGIDRSQPQKVKHNHNIGT